MIADGTVSAAALAPTQVTTYVPVSRLDAPVRVKVQYLELARLMSVPEDADLCVVCELWSAGRRLCAPAMTTRQAAQRKNVSRVAWMQLVQFPVAYRELPLDAVLCCTIWGSADAEEPFGGTTSYLFSTKGELKRGPRMRAVHRGRAADGRNPSATNGRVQNKTFAAQALKRFLSHQQNAAKEVPWLDAASHQQINRAQREEPPPPEPILHIEFPSFGAKVFRLDLPAALPDSYQPVPTGGLVTMRDPAIYSPENPCEVKALRIMKSQHLMVDPDLKPNSSEFSRIQVILRGSPLAPVGTEDANMLWRFRYYLCAKETGFVKFVRSVEWSDPKEAEMAAQMLDGWEGVSLGDCLELLGLQFKAITAVRDKATQRLAREPNKSLLEVMLQLVQALRYDAAPLSSKLTQLLFERASEDWEMCSYFFWYATVETHEANELASTFKSVVAELQQRVPPNFRAALEKQKLLMKGLGDLQARISAFSGNRAKQKTKAQELLREMSVPALREVFPHDVAGHERGQGGMLAGIGKSLQQAKTSMAHLAHLSHPGAQNAAENAPPQQEAEEDGPPCPKSVTTPAFPNIGITGVRPEDVIIFTSAKSPMALKFVPDNGEDPFMLMYKSGDDIRQDQLVMQVVTLIDRLLKQDGLDLRLTPYRVLATSVNEGLLRLVPECVQLQDILSNIHGRLRQFNEDPKGEFGLSKECLDNWVRSNAGYAVITYLLGIGDRHLENLMVTNDGRLFHIDFGFLMGRDPKPFPPPLKLRKEMVEVMGGTGSGRFKEFKRLCCSAYSTVRKHSALLLSSLAMMSEANMPDLTADVRVTKDVYSKIRTVESKLLLDLNDSEATKRFLEVLDTAIGSIMGRFNDFLHAGAVKLKTTAN